MYHTREREREREREMLHTRERGTEVDTYRAYTTGKTTFTELDILEVNFPQLLLEILLELGTSEVRQT